VPAADDVDHTPGDEVGLDPALDQVADRLLLRTVPGAVD